MSLDNQSDVTARVTISDGCRVLPKLRCYEVAAGQRVRLLWNITDDSGNVLSMEPDAGDSQSESEAPSPYSVKIRVGEAVGNNSLDYAQMDGSVLDAENGLISSDHLPQSIVGFPGLYSVNFGIFQGNYMLCSNQVYLFVKPSLFQDDQIQPGMVVGPPSISDIRMALLDFDANNQLLQDFEFDGADIANAVIRPVRMWNEMPPPIGLHTTKTFPFREIWMSGIQSFLLEAAAHRFRRNDLPYNGGNLTVNDMGKEQNYARAAAAYKQQFVEMMQRKKIEINHTRGSKSLLSSYYR